MARFRMECGCVALQLWRTLQVPGYASIPIPDGGRIVEACEDHTRLEGTAFELDDSPFLPHHQGA